jgi:Holliday junction resolvase-like predicted endonuclease
MDENAVVESVCLRMEEAGYKILERCTTTMQGIDVVAHDPSKDHHYYVEAKGGTSSRIGSARFGHEYTQSQVFDRVAKGIFTCMQLRARFSDRTNQHIVLAVPDSHWFYIGQVMTQLIDTGIEVSFHQRV